MQENSHLCHIYNCTLIIIIKLGYRTHMTTLDCSRTLRQKNIMREEMCNFTFVLVESRYFKNLT